MDDELKGLREAIVESIASSDRKLEVLYWLKDHHEKMIIAMARNNESPSWKASAYRALLNVNNQILEQLEFQKQAKNDIAVIDKELE